MLPPPAARVVGPVNVVGAPHPQKGRSKRSDDLSLACRTQCVLLAPRGPCLSRLSLHGLLPLLLPWGFAEMRHEIRPIAAPERLLGRNCGVGSLVLFFSPRSARRTCAAGPGRTPGSSPG